MTLAFLEKKRKEKKKKKKKKEEKKRTPVELLNTYDKHEKKSVTLFA